MRHVHSAGMELPRQRLRQRAHRKLARRERREPRRPPKRRRRARHHERRRVRGTRVNGLEQPRERRLRKVEEPGGVGEGGGEVGGGEVQEGFHGEAGAYVVYGGG